MDGSVLKNRFWAYIVEEYGSNAAGACQSAGDYEAYALFQAISRALTSRTNPLVVTVHYELFQYLANWAMNKVSCGACGQVVAGADGSYPDHHLRRTWDAFYWTLQEAVKQGVRRPRRWRGFLRLPLASGVVRRAPRR